MRTTKEKSEFIKTLKQEIKNREALRRFFDTDFQNLLQRFDGKVYNKRFDTALNEALKAVSPLMWAKCELRGRNSYSNFPQNNLLEVVLYFQKESFYTNVVLRYNLRISSEDSKSEKYTIVWAENFDKETEEEKGIITAYAKYLKMAEQMEKAVKAYNDLPHKFREHIDTKFLRIY